MDFKIALLPGDGIGPEVIAEAVKVLRALGEAKGHNFIFDEQLIGGVALRAVNDPLPQKTIDVCLASHAVLMGSVGSPEFDANPRDKKPETGLLRIRKALGGFANLRPVRAYKALAANSPLKNERIAGVDIMTVRELLGGAYFGEPRGFAGETGSADERAFNTMVYSRPEIERVAHVAFQLARQRGKRLTSVDKANVLEASQLWRRVVIEVGKQYPDVELDHCYVDSFAMRLVVSPAKIDTVLTENLFGDILTDESAVLTGSLGLLASATVGGAVDLYEPIHGSAPDIAGKGVANPIGTIASAAMMLRCSLKLEEEATAIETAIERAIDAGCRTADLVHGGDITPISTTAMGDRIVDELKRILS